MNILIASAAPHSGLGLCLPSLYDAGLAQARPTSSPAGQISPEGWHDRLFKAQGLSDLLAVPEQSPVIGKMWEELAVGMLLANMDHSPWGFADERATWALEFWAQLDPQTRFALGFVPLGQTVALYRQANPDASDEQVQALATAWVTYNEKILGFAARETGRTILFNLHEAAQQPLRLAHTCQAKLGIKQLDWNKLAQHSSPTWPAPEDVATLRLRNLGAVRTLQKKLGAASTPLLSPRTDVMIKAAPEKASSVWAVFGLFGKSKRLSKELSQVQQELEQVLASRDTLQNQLAALEAAKTQALTDAQVLHATADKKAADAEGRMRELQAKLAESDKKAADAEGRAREAQAKLAESDKKLAELRTELHAIQTKGPGQDQALKEAQEENDLLLKQLHQVQEELENYFLKHQEAEQHRGRFKERLDRVLMRLPAWADAEQISATEAALEKNHRRLRVDLQNLWVGQDEPLEKLTFILGVRDKLPYLEFRPGEGGTVTAALPWPESLKDAQGDRLILAPGAPGSVGAVQHQVVSSLSATQWRLVKGVLVLAGSQVNRLGLKTQDDRIYWANATKELTQSLDELSVGVHFQGAEIMAVTQPEPGVEVMRVAIRDLHTRTTRIPLCVFEVGIKFKTVKKSGAVPQHFFMDFRPWKGAAMPFANFNPNSQDAQGEFLRIDLPRTGRSKNLLQKLQTLDRMDLRALGHIGHVLQRMATEVSFRRFSTGLGQELWISEMQEVGLLLEVSAQEEDRE